MSEAIVHERALSFLADAFVEGGLLFLNLFVHRKQALDDGAQHVVVEQAPHMVAELSADRTRE